MASIKQAKLWAINKCNQSNVGYSQPYRNERTVNGITYYDCSSFVWYALKSAGYDVETAYRIATGNNYTNNAITTSALRAFLIALDFVQVSISGEWKPGDILWRSGHTEMVYSGGNARGVTMGAHSANLPLADQVSINSSESTTSSWSEIYRSDEDNPSGAFCSAEVVAAICGNFWQESGINPGIWEGLDEGTWTTENRGYGLGQWTNYNTQQGRLYNLHEFLSSNNYDNDDGFGELAFLIDEDYWTPHTDYSFQTLTEFLESDSTDITMLTHAFNQCWEGIHDSSWDDRVTYANDCYDYIMGHWNDQNEWIKGNRYLSDDDRYNNAVLIYQYLNGLEPENHKKKSKFWIYMRKRRGLIY